MIRRGGFLCGVMALAVAAGAQVRGSVGLRVDNLVSPLGIDDSAPRFSWQLKDDARGARQSAYEVQVGASERELAAGKATVWDSGRVASSASLNVRYAGAALKPGTRYYWRVKLWNAAGKPYAPSVASWWETGLMTQAAWQAAWIGYETPEESAVRHAGAEWITNADVKEQTGDQREAVHVAYRTSVSLAGPVRSATLDATCQNSVSAWVNGRQVLTAEALPKWGMLPWKKYVRADAGALLEQGANTVAVDCVYYDGYAHPPMSATLFVEYKDGRTAIFASNAAWKTALHAPEGWQQQGFDDAAWKPAVTWTAQTGHDADEAFGHPWIPDSVKALRTSFEAKGAIRSARLYATALGDYEIFLNGKRVSEDVLAPGWTDYRKRVAYQAYDVTALVVRGKNAIGALLAPGWYSTPLEWNQRPNNYGSTPPALRAQLRIEYADGSMGWVKTGGDWQAERSFIVSSELYDGERQDARLRQSGWNTASFDVAQWKPVLTIDPAPVEIVSQDFQTVRAEQTLTAVSMTEPKPGVYIYDFGQNLAGVERVRLAGPAGTDVKLRFAEILNSDGTMYVDNLRSAKATDHFILAGGTEEFSPQFTFHGFRYLEITGPKTAPAKDDVRAVVLHTAAPFTAKFTSGSAMVNKLASNILWGQRSNFVGVPTDCPQRDERLGWMADAQIFWRTASYNMDLAAFSRKFSRDMRGTQSGTPYFGVYAPGTAASSSASGAGWSDAGVVIPWTSWLQTGSTAVIDESWNAMEKYLAAIEAANPDGLWKNESGTPYGDWLAPEGATDQMLIATAYWAWDVTLMREMAHATGRTAAEQKYAAQFAKIQAAFAKQFVHGDGFVAGAASNNEKAQKNGGDTQTGYLMALHMNLVPAELRAAVEKRLVAKIEANHDLLGTGFLGTPLLLEELTKVGYTELAYKLLLTTEYPSWGYLVTHGATTMWEHWDSDKMKDSPGMNSYNHYGYGAVADWIYRYAAGVDATPLDAGFHTVVLHPAISAQLGSLAFDYDSSYGSIHSDWTAKDAAAVWHLTLPANTTGWISAQDAETLRLGGMPLAESRQVKARTLSGQAGFEISAGAWTFEVGLKK